MHALDLTVRPPQGRQSYGEQRLSTFENVGLPRQFLRANSLKTERP